VSREQRLRRLEEQSAVQEAPLMSAAEHDQRVQALVELHESRGWTSSGSADEDKRLRAILGVVVRAAERALREDPTPEALACAKHWRERLARFVGGLPS
jgi:hypothetical protein